MEWLPHTVLSVSHTTRPRRPGERHGVDYYFVDRAQFETMAAGDEFLEYAEVFGNLYGTSRDTVEALLRKGSNVILDIDWQGARKVRRNMPAVVSIFVLPPSWAELERRLRGRGQDTEAVIERRMREAADEMSHYGEYDYVVINDELEDALADLRAIIEGRGEHVRPLAVDVQSLMGEARHAG